MTERPPDAGTTNTWSFVEYGRVLAFPGGPSGPRQSSPVVLIYVDVRDVRDKKVIALTPHQARALLDVLPAAIAHAERTEEEE